VIGLYFYGRKLSARGELEITDLNKVYFDRELLTVERLGCGYVRFETGTQESLRDAAEFVRTIEMRHKITCAERSPITWALSTASGSWRSPGIWAFRKAAGARLVIAIARANGHHDPMNSRPDRNTTG
jgi:hypothetical protein